MGTGSKSLSKSEGYHCKSTEQKGISKEKQEKRKDIEQKTTIKFLFLAPIVCNDT
jgi:hypothetical protein